jgi:hypothetical protein
MGSLGHASFMSGVYNVRNDGMFCRRFMSSARAPTLSNVSCLRKFELVDLLALSLVRSRLCGREICPHQIFIDLH